MRSRAAFKLSQINRQFPVLEKAKAVLDLCAAPGGWTQVAARTCKEAAQIVAVDILPIRKFHNHRNVTTLVGDITTDKCKADIKREVKNLVDLVLHDGAPNIGASYDKDAYEQTELSVHALKCATQHLKHNGTFITKIYRSRDYASYQWVVKQLFQDVSVLKPKSSRSQSAEIYIICQGYLKPDKIDPRLLDPKHIFEMVEGDTTVANTQGSASWNVFHKSWDKQKRHRDGYDMEEKDFTMRKILPVSDFLLAANMKDAIKLLSQCTGFQFQCPVCEGETTNSNDKKKKAAPAPDCKCRFFLHHPLTTHEIKECATDLKVLNKGDFKGLLLWREKMEKALEAIKEREKDAARGSDDEASDDDDDSSDEKVVKKPDMDDDDEEAQVQGEIAELRLRKQRERKKLKKKDRAKMAKKRRHAALGMDLNAIDVPDHDQVFSLATLTSKGDLELVSEINLDQVTDEQLFGMDEESDDDAPAPKIEKDEDTGYSYRLDRELDSAYDRYLSVTKDGMAKSGTKMAKRSKKLQRQKMVEEAQEDQDMVMTGADNLDNDTRVYAEMLQGPKDSDDEDSDSGAEDHEDDGFGAEPMTPEEHAAANKKKQQKTANKSPKLIKAEPKSKNPLIHEFPDEPTSIKTARWFSNPLFATLGEQAEAAAEDKHGRVPEVDAVSSDEDNEAENSEDEVSVDDEDSDDEKPKKKAKNGNKGLDADDVLASMPKTDKQIRHEKRLKALERNERRQARKAKILGESEGAFDLAPAQEDAGSDSEDEKLAGLSDEKKRKILEARALIKAGMGAVDDSASSNKFEVVEQDRPLPSLDARKYDSDNEDYDSDDYARTMALGTMMLRRSKAKALVDASYNRFSWNDPTDLPEWFVDDENRHYRPQLPVPPALLEKMKEKMLALSTKPIAKVAEARARKSRNAQSKLAAAKKKAQLVANSSEMSESMKLKSISKALRGADSKRPGKTYVVAKKGGGTKGGKGLQVVDKRLKNDKRSMERSSKTKKNGKKGGMTGGKQRRHHK